MAGTSSGGFSRKRIAAFAPMVTGGGGGTSTPVIDWGPDFGESSGADGNTWIARGAITMPSLALSGQLTARGAITMPSLALSGQLAVLAAITMPSLALSGQMGARGAFQDPSFTTSAMIASKDSWVDAVALCPVDLNHNGTDLQVDPTIATATQTIVGFDLSGFPTGSTVTSATLTMYLKTVPLLGTAADTITDLTSAGETWNETTVKCSTKPALGSDALNFDFGSTTGDKNVSLSAGQLTYIASRMGVGTCSFYITGQAGTLAHTFQSKDSGGSPGNASGPRLAISFTHPK